MPKINPNKHIQRRRTEREMREALVSLANDNYVHRTFVDVDDADIILQDCIEELLEARQLLEEVRGFVQTWHAKFQRK